MKVFSASEEMHAGVASGPQTSTHAKADVTAVDGMWRQPNSDAVQDDGQEAVAAARRTCSIASERCRPLSLCGTD